MKFLAIAFVAHMTFGPVIACVVCIAYLFVAAVTN